MPELPEVEFARRSLERWLRGAEITAVHVHDARIVRGGGSPSKLAAKLQGQRVKSVDRRGKWLRLEMANGQLLFSHLGMTGKWVSAPPLAAAVRFERARIDAKRPRSNAVISVRYRDPRLLGGLQVAGRDIPTYRALGPDPLHDGVSAAALFERLHDQRRTIKEALLDQRVLAGIGNIQATEALFRARIDPRTSAGALDKNHVRALARAIDASLAFTLESQGGPEITYVEESKADNPFLIYGRAGQPCPRCGRTLEKVSLAGRTTSFCPTCQASATAPKRSAAARHAETSTAKKALAAPPVRRPKAAAVARTKGHAAKKSDSSKKAKRPVK